MNGISSIAGGMSLMQNMYGVQKPDPKEAAQQLFAKLDIENQGYIEKSDLQSALQSVSSVSEASDLSTDESDLDALFSQLDSDGDGKITEQEFKDSLTQIDEQINNLFSQMRMNDAQSDMPPPPPPPNERDSSQATGFTAEELTAQLEEIGDSDSKRSTLIQNIIDNFDEADTDGDGRVNLEEAMAFDQASGSSTSDNDEATQIATNDSEYITNEKVMMQIMRLMEAYNVGGDAENGDSSILSVTT
jgi:Ca2+-binding EF-hand superfamily protein